jgi:hypothetical protein
MLIIRSKLQLRGQNYVKEVFKILLSEPSHYGGVVKRSTFID